MTDRNSPEEIAKRASQPDPLVMYLIVRESLGMGVGKMCAQCAHASQMLQLKFAKMVEILDYIHDDNDHNRVLLECSVFELWLDTSYRKVVLRADDKEFEKLKEFTNHVVVVDAGLTEIAAGSETVIGLWPMLKSEAQKTMIKKLQTLK